ncbi:hypothetical protein BDB01DRAFT_718684 [Pilobolus umbonatus]|nr:hypothetical protein BDB01DRAFT_718684 [Pilobolus umbonatus]
MVNKQKRDTLYTLNNKGYSHSFFQDATTLPCTHVFCRSCILENDICPLCNQSIDQDQLHEAETIQAIVDEFQLIKEFKDESGYYAHKSLSDAMSLQDELLSHENKLVQRNTTYYMGILNGCYIVNDKWLDQCQKERKLVPEDRFEILGDTKSGRTGAPSKARKCIQQGGKRLFDGMWFSIPNIGDIKAQKEFQKYVLSGGGKIDSRLATIVILCGKSPEKTRDELDAFKGKDLLLSDWIIECICHYELVRKEQYMYKYD